MHIQFEQSARVEARAKNAMLIVSVAVVLGGRAVVLGGRAVVLGGRAVVLVGPWFGVISTDRIRNQVRDS